MSMWVAGGLAVASMAVSVAGQNSAAKAGGKQASRTINQQNMQSVADNEAVVRSNMQSIVRTNYKAGMLNMQLGLRKKQLLQEGHSVTAQTQQVLGAANVNAAAAGSVGSSVDAVVNDITMKAGEAQAQLRENYNQELTNFNNELESIALNNDGAIQSARKYESFGAPEGPSSAQMWGTALMAGAGTFMSLYGQKSQNLNLGTTGSMAQQQLSTGYRGDINMGSTRGFA